MWSVIYQRQGEASASLLPNGLTGYGFLFAHGAQCSNTRPQLAIAVHGPLTLAAESSDAAMQLVVERLALNLREAGFNVQVKAAWGWSEPGDRGHDAAAHASGGGRRARRVA